MTLIKICGVTSLDDALHACECGASALGFNFWPGSKRYIALDAAAEIIARLPGGVLKVGVFVDADSEQLSHARIAAGLDLVQLHGSRPDSPGLRHWLALAATDAGIQATMKDSQAEAFLIDAPAGEERGGTGRTFDWSLVDGLKGRIILAGGLGPDNVAGAIQRVHPYGVDACSRLESSPGRKDRMKVMEFIRAARSAAL